MGWDVIVVPRSTRAEIAQDGEHATVVAVTGRQPELGEDVVDVLFHRAAADDECGGDAGVGPAFGHQREYLAFARGELAERVAAAGEQLRDDFGIERAAALGHPVQRVEELPDVGDPVFEQVADARAGGRRSVRWRTAPPPTGTARGRPPPATGPGPPAPRAVPRQ